MMVHSVNGSLQQRILSGTGSIGGIHLPDFNDNYVWGNAKRGLPMESGESANMENLQGSFDAKA